MTEQKTKSSTGKRVYYSIYFTLVGLLVAAIVFGLVKLWGFLTEYEQSQHYHATDAVLAELNSGDYTKLVGGISEKISEYETEEMLRKQFAERFSGEFTCVKSGKYSTDNAPAFMLKCGGENIAVMHLKKSGTTADYALDTFAFDRISGVTVQKGESVCVTVPSNCTFTINGCDPSGELFLTERMPNAQKFGEYIKGEPVMRTYKFGGLMNPPEIVILDENGKSLPVSCKNGVYSAALPITDSAKAENAADYAFEFSKRYNEFVSNDIGFTELSLYLVKGSALYSNLRDFMAQYYGYHTGYEFRNKEIVSVTQYSDNCFEVSLKYQHVLFSYEEVVYDIAYTVFVAETDSGWKTTDLIMN